MPHFSASRLTGKITERESLPEKRPVTLKFRQKTRTTKAGERSAPFEEQSDKAVPDGVCTQRPPGIFRVIGGA